MEKRETSDIVGGRVAHRGRGGLPVMELRVVFVELEHLRQLL
jgi:hypothetical protein